MFKVYYTDPKTWLAHAHDIQTLSEALQCTEMLRKSEMTCVTMVSENPNSVGKAGVDEIKDGVCPDGVAYDWSKASRIGAMKKR